MILIVEHNKERKDQLWDSLQAKYEVKETGTGKQALVKAQEALPELILMNAQLPDMSAEQVINKLLSIEGCSDIPVIILSENVSVEVEERYLTMGAADFIRYPIDTRVLLRRVEHSLEWKKLQKNLETQVFQKVQEIEEKKAEMERQKAIVEMAGRDPLTGLLTRNSTMNQINAILKNQSHGAFCMLDLDNFKSVNDIYGHIEGDRLLVRFANVLKRNAGENALIGRIGGDEFVIFLKEKMSREAIKRYTSHILEAVENEITSPGKLVKVTVSIGISIVPHDGMTFEELYGNADKALYYVKNDGKNAIRFYQEPRGKKTRQELTDTSIKSIKLKMKESEDMPGSYMVDYASFENIYRFMERNIDREKRTVQCVLFTVSGLDVEFARRDVVKEEMSYLEIAITGSLRKGDVSAIYSATQMLVLLMDVDRKNATSVVNRIVSEYHKLSKDTELTLEYEMEALGTESLEIRAMNA